MRKIRRLSLSSGDRITRFTRDPQGELNNEKALPPLNEERGLLSANRRIVILRGSLTMKNPCPAKRGNTVFFLPAPPGSKLPSGHKEKSPTAFALRLFLCSGGRIRTSDLWVMSPTSCHCSTPQSERKDTTYYLICKIKYIQSPEWNIIHTRLLKLIPPANFLSSHCKTN